MTLVSRISSSVNDKRDIGGHTTHTHTRTHTNSLPLPPAHYEELFKLCHSQYQGEGPTGMLFIYPEHVVQMVECSWELIEVIVRDSISQTESNRCGEK